MTTGKRTRLARLCGSMALVGTLSAFGAADIDYKYDTSGRSGTIVEPTGTTQAFEAFDSTSSVSAAWASSLPSVLVQYFSVFESNVAEILTNPPGACLILR